jgi:uncharacterized protein (TIGR04255 family)
MSMGKGRDNEVYPNSPLIDVTCEIRFPGELQVECDRHTFWNKIRKTYPDVLVPQAKDGQAAALQHYRFRSVDQSRIVSVAMNSLAFSESKYSGHAKFLGEFGRLARLFHACFPKIDKVNRFGWRYVNLMPFQREQGMVPVRRFLNARIDFPMDVLSSLKNFDARFEVDRPGGLAIIRVANVLQNGQPEGETLLLDLDLIRTSDKLRFKDSVKEITKARLENRKLFEELITDEYREYLRGGQE